MCNIEYFCISITVHPRILVIQHLDYPNTKSDCSIRVFRRSPVYKSLGFGYPNKFTYLNTFLRSLEQRCSGCTVLSNKNTQQQYHPDILVRSYYSQESQPCKLSLQQKHYTQDNTWLAVSKKPDLFTEARLKFIKTI